MISAEQAWKDQDDLNGLINGEHVNREPFVGNGFYGNANVLREYMGTDKPIPYTIQHGVALHGNIWPPEIYSKLPIYCWQKNRLDVYRNHTDKRIMFGTCPYLYAYNMAENGDKPERRGTVFFPAHSTQEVTSTMDAAQIIEWMNKLPDKYKPVDVCIYFRDYQQKKHAPYLDAGFRVISAGNMFDTQFNFRLVHLLRRYKYAASNDVGSQLFYSIASGCIYFQVPVDFEFQSYNDSALDECIYSKPDDEMTRFRQAFEYPQGKPGARTMLMVANYLGAENYMQPDVLRRHITA